MELESLTTYTVQRLVLICHVGSRKQLCEVWLRRCQCQGSSTMQIVPTRWKNRPQSQVAAARPMADERTSLEQFGRYQDSTKSATCIESEWYSTGRLGYNPTIPASQVAWDLGTLTYNSAEQQETAGRTKRERKDS